MPNRRYIIESIAFFFFLGLFIVDIQAEPITKFKRLRNKAHNYSILLPEDWLLKEGVGMFSLVAFKPIDGAKSDFRENISIASHKSSASLERHAEMNLKSMKNRLKDLKILKQENIEINQMKAKMLIYSYMQGNVKEVIFFTTNGHTLYIVRGTQIINIKITSKS